MFMKEGPLVQGYSCFFPRCIVSLRGLDNKTFSLGLHIDVIRRNRTARLVESWKVQNIVSNGRRAALLRTNYDPPCAFHVTSACGRILLALVHFWCSPMKKSTMKVSMKVPPKTRHKREQVRVGLTSSKEVAVDDDFVTQRSLFPVAVGFTRVTIYRLTKVYSAAPPLLWLSGPRRDNIATPYTHTTFVRLSLERTADQCNRRIAPQRVQPAPGSAHGRLPELPRVCMTFD